MGIGKISARTAAELARGRGSIRMAQAWGAADDFLKKWRPTLDKDIEINVVAELEGDEVMMIASIHVKGTGDIGTFKEPWPAFPSELLCAKMMLVSQ